jgi:hypothetical protein
LVVGGFRENQWAWGQQEEQPQPEEWEWGEGQESQEGKEEWEATEGAKVERSFLRLAEEQEGQWGVSPEETSASKSRPQSRQRYS